MIKKLILFVLVFSCFGCEFNEDPYDGAIVSSTVYPVTYLMETLYGEYSVIDSIYPNDEDVETYTLSEKQINNYAKGSDLFIYLGITDEKNIAKDFVNKNQKILLVDATINLTIKDSVEELWLSPNNYLMLAKNIRDNLFESLQNQYILEYVDANYEALAETLSVMDAELRQIANKAVENNNSIIVSTSDAFLYLENFGFTVISLESEDNQGEDALKAIQNNFKNGRYLALINDGSVSSDITKSLINDYDAKSIDMNTFYSSDKEEDYLEALHNFIFNLELVVND